LINFEIVPNDLGLIKKYEFYIMAVMEDGINFWASSLKTLYVG